MSFPGNLPLKGKVPIILAPKPSRNTLTLQAISPSGKQVTRSVALEIYASNPTNLEKITAAAATSTATQIAQAQQQAEQDQAKITGIRTGSGSGH